MKIGSFVSDDYPSSVVPVPSSLPETLLSLSGFPITVRPRNYDAAAPDEAGEGVVPWPVMRVSWVEEGHIEFATWAYLRGLYERGDPVWWRFDLSMARQSGLLQMAANGRMLLAPHRPIVPLSHLQEGAAMSWTGLLRKNRQVFTGPYTVNEKHGVVTLGDLADHGRGNEWRLSYAAPFYGRIVNFDLRQMDTISGSQSLYTGSVDVSCELWPGDLKDAWA